MLAPAVMMPTSSGASTGAVVAGLEAPVALDSILVGTRMRIDSGAVYVLGLAVEENVMGKFVPVDMQKATRPWCLRGRQRHERRHDGRRRDG